MKLLVYSILPLLLITAAICISASSPAVARDPVPAKKLATINPSYADPGEDPHLSILVEPVPACSEESGASGGSLTGGGQVETIKIDRIDLTYKFGLFIYSFYRNIDKIIF